MTSTTCLKEPSHPRILIVNDDGIGTHGIMLLERIARQMTPDVWVVAPRSERSGSSHAISISNPIRIQQVDDRHYAVEGTPVDCVLLGVYAILPGPPTVILSGINWGENLGEDVIYSGTTAPAIEGSILGISSIAISLVHAYDDIHWDTVERFLPAILNELLKRPFERGYCYNINVPPVSPDQVTAMAATRLGLRKVGSFKPVKGVDPRKLPYYWIGINYIADGKRQSDGTLEDNSDLNAIAKRQISITPIGVDMTARSGMADLRDSLSKLWQREGV